MSEWLKGYLGMVVAIIPAMTLLIAFSFGVVAARWPYWAIIVGLIVVVHLMVGWVFLVGRLTDRWLHK